MERRSILILALFMTCAMQAQLHHSASATLQQHMWEVNAQWRTQGIVPPDADRTIAFNSEAERIAMHLRLVREHLSAKQNEGSSATQTSNRTELLDALSDYADRGTFPRNHVLPYRNPVFIDPYGTACAVGQLMIESGRDDLASRIRDEMNTFYLLDMNWPEIGDWASENGLVAEELAWIQPGYPPSLPWAPLGGGTNAPVTAIHRLASGDLLVAGSFTDAGGTTVTNVAIWDGVSYTSLGNGVAGEVTSAIEFNGDIYLGGNGFGTYGDLAHWDGTQWSYHAIFEGKWPHINTLHVHNGELYAAGEAMGFAGVDHAVRKVNTDFTYTQLGSFLNGRVLAMESYLGFLVIGGEFTGFQNNTDPLISHIAIAEGNEWSQLADGTDAPVRALLAHGEDLYIGGDLFINIAVTFGLAKLSSMGPLIEPLLPNHANYTESGLGPVFIKDMVMHDGLLYFTGRFNFYDLMLIGTTVAVFDGTLDGIEPMMEIPATGNTITMMGNRLVVGGDLPEFHNNITSLDISTGIVDRAEVGMNISPNPAATEVVVRLADSGLPVSIEVLDASGRLVFTPSIRMDNTLRVNVEALSPGAYILRAKSEGHTIDRKFIKE